MNFLGKILAMFVMIASVAFMVFAIFVWAVNRNYYDQIQTKLLPDIKRLTADRDRLSQEKDNFKKQLDAEVALRQMTLAAAQAETAALAQQNKELAERQRQADSARDSAVTQGNAATENARKLTAELETVSAQLRKAELDRNELWAVARAQTDKANQTKLEKDQLEAVAENLVARLSRFNRVVDGRGGNVRVGEVPEIRGLVVDVKGRNVAVSVGQDDGIKVGDTLEIYSESKYLGRIRVVVSKPDGAVGEIITDFQKGAIQRGDNVTTRFKVG